MDAAKVKVRDAERWLLSRWWWVFPSVAVLLAMLTGGGFWAWVEGGRPWLDWRQAFTLRSVAFVVAGLAVVVGWRLFLNRKWPGWAVWMLAASGFACVELAVRNPAAQTAFWLAAENRIPAKANMSFMHDVCHVRLDAAAVGDDPRPAIILVGSSQVVQGVDEELLARLLPERRIVKRAVSSLRPLQALVAENYIPVRSGDVVVHYLSEFDFTNQEEFPFSWFRPFAGWGSLGDVLETIGRRSVAKEWRGAVDYALAATFETWRGRDWMRTAFTRFWGCAPEDRIFDARIPDNPDGMWFARDNARNDGLSPSLPQKRAFEQWIGRVAAKGASVVVFEGQVNPVWRTPERQALHGEVEQWLSSFGEKGIPVVYFHQEESFPADFWADMTHLNESGRKKLTEIMGRQLKQFPDDGRFADEGETPKMLR